MVARDLEVLDDAFVDGDARHDDDEFAEAVAPPQFVDRAEVHVGLAGPCLHLNRETGVTP